MEDAQPNEVRLARKGSTAIPRVRAARTGRAQSSSHRPHLSHDSRPPRRITRQLPATRAPLPDLLNKEPRQELAGVGLTQECYTEMPGNPNAHKRWFESQKHCTNRHLSDRSLKYLDRDKSVLSTGRTRRATQPTEHDTRGNIVETGSHPIKAYLDAESVSITRRDAMAASLTKTCDNPNDFAQDSEPGPSRSRPTPQTPAGPGSYPQHIDNQSLIPSPSSFVEKKPVGLSTAETKLHPVPAMHTNSVRRRRATMRKTSPTKSMPGRTLGSPGPVVEEDPTRWLTFRSGCLNIRLPPMNDDPRALSSEASLCPRPRIETPVQFVGPPEIMPIVRSNGTDRHPTQPNISVNHTPPVHSMSKPISNQLRQHDALETVRPYHSHHPLIQRDEADVLPSLLDYTSLVRGFTLPGSNLSISLGPHDKPRRILHDNDFICVVTTHGTINRVNATRALELGQNIRSPSLPFEEFVHDACILSHHGGPIIILGHAREQDQISCLYLDHGQVPRHVTLRREAIRLGISSITSLMSPLKFASGGHDHRVHIWDITQDLSDASSVELAIKHTSRVHSLLSVVDTSHKLVSVGADCDVPIYDISAERVVRTLKMSCIPFHVHKTDFLSCTLFEVAHLETQFEVRDYRTSRKAVQRFGFVTEEKRGRFEKADTWSHFVVCGDSNGAIRLWDLRNVSTHVALRQCFNDPVIQAVHTGPRLLACSKRNELVCFDFRGE